MAPLTLIVRQKVNQSEILIQFICCLLTVLWDRSTYRKC